MSLAQRLRRLLGAAMLGAAVMVGAPLRPKEIEELMHAVNQQEIAEVIPTEDDTNQEPGYSPPA